MRDEAGRKPFAAVVVDARGPDEVESLNRAQSTLARWRRSGLAVAVVCTRQGANALRDHETFAAVIDESGSGQPTLEATVRLFGEATLRLDAAPLDTLVAARAVISVAAAKALGFRRIVGVERNGDATGLLAAGAQSVVDDLRDLRFPRALPGALQCLNEIAAWRGGRSLAVFLDYDGTLTPIVAHPADARLAPEMRELLGRLAQRFSVAVISGRDRPDLAERVGLTDIYYAGSHGLDIAGPGTRYSPPGAAAATRQIQAAAEVIARDLQDVTGVVIEHKRYSAAVHYRQVDAAWSDRVIDAVTRTASAAGLRVRSGKQVRELVPDVDWHKGRALTWLRDVLGVDAQHTALVYVGDDETDEDAFRALGADGIGLRPGSRVAASLADYHLADVAEVHQFLQWLLLDPVSVRGPDHEA